MATVEAFSAFRYNPDKVADLSAVVAPPYDVYDEAERDELLREPLNIAHLDSPRGSTDAQAPGSRYAAATATFASWLRDGVLRRDPQPAIYCYEQQYRWETGTLSRRMVIGRVRLEPLGEGSIHPHERTFSGPKEDRYQLTLATRCNLSQPLAFYIDPDRRFTRAVERVYETPPAMSATDRDGSISRVWPVTDSAAIRSVTGALAGCDLYIADGHHRYETSLRYLQTLEAAGDLAADHPARYCAMVLVGSGDPGLRVMPTHRVVTGLRRFEADLLVHEAADSFVWTARGDVSRRSAEQLAEAVRLAPQPSVGVLTREQFGILAPRAGEAPRTVVKAAGPLRRLNVTVLDDWLMPTVIQPKFGTGETTYVHRVDEAMAALDRGASVAFLLHPCSVEAITEVAELGELMPQKSTYFYPKVLTGLVIYPLVPGR